MTSSSKPPFFVSAATIEEKPGRYPGTDEVFSLVRSIGRAAGLTKIDLRLLRVLPGQRTSLPHAEEKEEEFVYLLSGTVDAWINGVLHAMQPHDLVAFPAGTGICHTFLNNSDQEALLLVGGESQPGNRVVYPLNPETKTYMRPGKWWEDASFVPQGDHDALPNAKTSERGT